MTRHTRRSSAGRFTSASTSNTPEASEGRFPTRTDLPLADESGADWPGAEMQQRHGPSADGETEHSIHRRAVVVDAHTGQHLADLTEVDLLRLGRSARDQVKIDAAGHHDATTYSLTGE